MGTSLFDGPVYGQDSAISNLLAQLTGTQPQVTQQGDASMPSPQASPLPPSTPMSAAQPSLLRRVLNNLQSLPGAVADSVSPHPSPTVQAAVEAGLISADDAKRITPGWLDRLALIEQPGGVAQLSQSRLGNLLGVQQLAQQVAQQRALAKVRGDLAAMQFPSGTTPADILRLGATHLALGGDIEGAAKVAQAAKDLQPPNAPLPKTDLYHNPKTNEYRFIPDAANTSLPPDFEPIKTVGQGSAPIQFERGPNTPKNLPAYVDVARGDNATLAQLGAQGYRPRVEQQAMYNQGMIQGRFDINTVKSLQSMYDRGVKGLTDQAEVYNKAYQTLDRAAHATDQHERTLLYGAVQSQFTQSSDQAKNLRYQLLQYYTSHQSPALGSTFQIFFDRLTKGELPTTVIEPMLSHVKALANENARQIQSRRTEFLNNNAGLIGEGQIPSASSYYTYPGLYDPNYDPTAGLKGGSGAKYSPNNPFAKKP